MKDVHVSGGLMRCLFAYEINHVSDIYEHAYCNLRAYV